MDVDRELDKDVLVGELGLLEACFAVSTGLLARGNAGYACKRSPLRDGQVDLLLRGELVLLVGGHEGAGQLEGAEAE